MRDVSLRFTLVFGPSASTASSALAALSTANKGRPRPSRAQARLLMAALRLSATGETKLAAGKMGLEHVGQTKPAGAVLAGYWRQYSSKHLMWNTSNIHQPFQSWKFRSDPLSVCDFANWRQFNGKYSDKSLRITLPQVLSQLKQVQLISGTVRKGTK